MLVRDGTAEDQAGMWRLLRELHGEAAETMTLPHVRRAARTFVAVDGGEVVGVVVGTCVNYGHEPYGMVEELVVAPGRGGARIGAALLDECRGWRAESGAEVVFVSAVGAEAAEFYLRGGFIRCVGPWPWAGTATARE